METLDLGQVVPNIGVGTVTALDPTAKPTITKSTSSTNTDIKYDFGIPSPATFAEPVFNDTTNTYASLTESNTAAETASNAIVSGNNFFTMLSNMKKSFSAIIQGLKFLGTNVGAITGITSDLNGESETVAASIKAVNTLNASLNDLNKKTGYINSSNSFTPARIIVIQRTIDYNNGMGEIDISEMGIIPISMIGVNVVGSQAIYGAFGSIISAQTIRAVLNNTGYNGALPTIFTMCCSINMS